MLKMIVRVYKSIYKIKFIFMNKIGKILIIILIICTTLILIRGLITIGDL